jgi:GIY-YIG catalytic domain
MPAWGPIITTLSKSRVGLAVWWVLKMIGLDKVIEMAWNAIERGLSRIGERGMAIRKARHTKEGSWAPVVVEGRTRWVVYSGPTPIDIFPPINGDLTAAMETFDTARLREPDDVPSTRAMAWARDRLSRLGGRDGESDADVATAQSPGAYALREALATSGEEGGQTHFHALVDQLPTLLAELAGAPAKTVTEHNGIPDKPGIYLFREGVNPIYVGQTRNLRTRLGEHTSPSSRENQAALAWRIALKEAAEAGHPVAGTGKDVEADAQFAEHFREAKKRVAEMDVQFIELDDPVTRTVFEVYAARALGTDEFNSWETH